MTTSTESGSRAVSTLASTEPTSMTGKQILALIVMCSTILLISLDQTVLNVALPTLVKDLHPSGSGLEWIADSYTLTNAVFLLFGGALGDRFGRRRLFVIGATIFGGGSLGCALVHSTWPLVGARAVTGLGAACMMPATLSILVATFTGHQRAQAIGIWAGVGGLGGAAGPLLGGWLLQHFWWGSVFLINVPLAVLAVVGALWAVSESRAERAIALDPIGVVLSGLGLAVLTYAFIVAPTKHWGSSTVIGSLVLAVVILAVFLAWDGRKDDPLLDLSLFKNRTFSSGIGALTALFFVMFGVSFLLSQYIQFVQGNDVFAVGLRFVPLALGMLITSNTAARFTGPFGLRPVLLAGMLLVGVGLAILATVSATSGYLSVGVAFACIGLGMGLAIAPASNAVVGTLPPDKVGAGSGLRSMVQLLGGSFGVAIIGSLATGRYHSGLQSAFRGPLRDVPASARSASGDQVGQAIIAARRLSPPLGQRLISIADHAFVSGLRLGAIIGVVVLVLATAAVAAYVPHDVDTGDDPDREPDYAPTH